MGIDRRIDIYDADKVDELLKADHLRELKQEFEEKNGFCKEEDLKKLEETVKKEFMKFTNYGYNIYEQIIYGYRVYHVYGEAGYEDGLTVEINDVIASAFVMTWTVYMN